MSAAVLDELSSDLEADGGASLVAANVDGLTLLGNQRALQHDFDRLSGRRFAILLPACDGGPPPGIDQEVEAELLSGLRIRAAMVSSLPGEPGAACSTAPAPRCMRSNQKVAPRSIVV